MLNRMFKVKPNKDFEFDIQAILKKMYAKFLER